MSDYVLALDPGATTGSALWNFPDGHVNVTQRPWLEACYWMHDFLHRTREEGGMVEVVCESFVITQATLRKSRQAEALWVIGVARYLSHLYRFPEVVEQSPSQAKSFATDAKLRKVGWYLKGVPHGVDAARHLLVYLIDRGRFDVSVFV